MIKNAIAYITRKRNRTLIIFIILTIVLSCLYSCLTIMKSSDEIEKALYESSNSSISITRKDGNYFNVNEFKDIEKLKEIEEIIKYIEELKKKNVVFLVTGNAVELFGKYIENEDGSRIEALSIFDIYAKRDMMHRHNSIFLGKYEDIEIVGFKSQFTMTYGDNENNYFVEAEKGIGLNKESKLEGIKQNNFIGTYLIGPILILNPLFTKKLIQMLGVEKPTIAFEKETMEAYEQRLEEFKR